MRPVVRVANVRVRSRATDPTLARGTAFGVAVDCDDMLPPYVVVFRTHRYGLRNTVPSGTVRCQENKEKKLKRSSGRGSGGAVMEGLGAYKVEKSGSRRSSVERREEILG